MKSPLYRFIKVLTLGFIFFFSISNSFAQNTIFTNQIPTHFGNDSDYELGTKFISSEFTNIKAIRFYKAPSETGTHTGHIWSETGNLIASVDFINETESGWQVAYLAAPLFINPNEVYVVSVNCNSIYPIEQHALTTSITNGILSTVADNNNGVFNVTPGSFPTGTFHNSNYFVDVISSGALNSIFTTETPTRAETDGPYEMGIQFTVSQNAKLEYIRYYRSANETGAHVGHLWNSTTNALIATATFENETAVGWQYAKLLTDVFLEPGITYVASVNSNSEYSASDANALNASVTNGVLTTIPIVNGLYGNPNNIPNNTYQSTNYFRDVLVEPYSTPAVPTLTYPLVNSYTVGIEPTFSWALSNDADSYTFQLATDINFNNLVVNVSNLTTNYYSVTGLSNSTIYYWRVKAKKYNLESIFTSAYKFTTVATQQISLSWPINGVQVYTQTPNLVWYLPAGGTNYSYSVLYSTDQTFTTYSIINNVTTNQFTLSGLVPGVTYYWKVKLISALGEVVCYSAAQSFKTYGTAVKPVPSWPIGGNTVYTLQQNLMWYLNDASFGLTYEVELVEGGVANLTGVADYTTTNKFVTVSLVQGKQYSWAVRSKSGLNYSTWATATFKVISIPSVVVPTISYPKSSTVVYTLSPKLYWYITSNTPGLKYEVEYVEGSGTAFSDNPDLANITGLNTQLTNLEAGKTYKWQVRSTDGTNYSAWSSAGTFKTAATLAPVPTKPIASWPINNASVYAEETQLSWYLNSNSTGLTYDVELRDGTLTGVPTDSNIGINYTSSGTLQPNTTYYWAVRSKIGMITSDWSTTQKFKTVGSTVVATIPKLSWPIGGTTVYSNTQLLSWYLNSASAGLTYELKYSTEQDMSFATVVPNIGETQYLLTNLQPGTPYYWQVRSFDGTVYSNFSTKGHFVTHAGISPVMPIAGSPIEGVQIENNAPVLSWFLLTPGEISGYEIEYSTSNDMSSANTILTNESEIALANLDPVTEYFWRVRSKTTDGTYSAYSNTTSFITNSVTSVNEGDIIVSDYNLKQNYPNPFNPSTTIEFSLKESGLYTLEVYNILGQKIATLINGNYNAGAYKVNFNGTNLSSGMYIYKLSGNNINLTKKMMMIK